MRRSCTALAAAVLAVSTLALPAAAWVHVARAGETLEQLARRYYGRPEQSKVIRAANGFVHPNDGRLIEGERVEIPEVTYHRARRGDDWESIAEHYLGSARRGAFLAELNDKHPDEPLVEGKIIKIPYQLLYILAPDESLKAIARDYLGRARGATWLKDYNLKQKKKYGRGDALLVPLVDVEFAEDERRRTDAERGEQYSGKDLQAQIDAVAQIAAMRKAFATGRYVRMVATGQRLLHVGQLTVPQQIGVHKYLAFAYVALGARQMAHGAFIEAIALQPGMELSPITTSPKILEVFHEAREKAIESGVKGMAKPAASPGDSGIE
jgi:phage tail protein X